MRFPPKKAHTTSLLIPLLATPHLVTSWGQFPHRTIAILATRFFLPETAQFVNTVLPKSESIAAASLWPDYYSHTPEGRWSGPLHYIDGFWDEKEQIQDHHCGLIYNRDCGGPTHCVIWGTVNNTRQLLLPYKAPRAAEIEEYERKQALTSLPFEEVDAFEQAARDNHHHHDSKDKGVDSTTKGKGHPPPAKGRPPPADSPTWLTPHHLSLRFLVHFIGDLHQPLHTIGYEKGGNGIEVRFDGKKSNLHSAWDTLIPVYGYFGNRLGTVTPQDSVAWAETLFGKIHSMRSSLSAGEWDKKFVGQCFKGLESGVADPKKLLTDRKIQDCALEWAAQANSYVCSFAFARSGGTDGLVDSELTGKKGGYYAEDGFKIAEELVMLAGWRLGAWLNLMVTGKTGFGEQEEGGSLRGGQVVLEQEEL